MSFKTKWGLGAIAAATLLAVPALAQDDYIPDDNITPEESIYDSGRGEHRDRGLFNELNVAVSGGVNTYTGDLGNDTTTGGYLGVQANSRPLPLVGLELGYEGSRNAFENIDGGLWRHNVGALAKVGPELLAKGSLRPFVGAGFGMSLLNPSGDGELLFSNDVVTEVPLAAGVDYKFGGVTAGARATYRLVGGENLGQAQNGNIVNFGLQVGGAF